MRGMSITQGEVHEMVLPFTFGISKFLFLILWHISMGILLLNRSHELILLSLRSFAGDISKTVTAICFTIPGTATGSSLLSLESGSDYKARGMDLEYQVVFPAGVRKASCDVKVKNGVSALQYLIQFFDNWFFYPIVPYQAL